MLKLFTGLEVIIEVYTEKPLPPGRRENQEPAYEDMLLKL